MPKASGYSGTPLSKKLGIREGSRVCVIGADDDYRQRLSPLPTNVVFEKRAGRKTDLVHLFVICRDDLAKRLAALRKKLAAEAVVWVSWPKKASGVPTTIAEDTIRELALPLGLVDVKVCAVSDVWSALKLVVRKELR